jgi:hypothetical protein
MNHATTYPRRSHHKTRRQAPSATTPAARKVRTMDAKIKRRQSDKKRQTTISSAIDASNAILKCIFMPKLDATEWESAARDSQTEREFYDSLSSVAALKKIDLMPSQKYGFPYNMLLAMWDLEHKLQVESAEDLYIAQTPTSTHIATKERFSTQTTLYYIPVVPLYKMLNDSQKKSCAMLLLSVFSYLYRIVNVPYYRQEDSYLFWQYEMVDEWVHSDPDTEEGDEDFWKESRQASIIGDLMERKIRNSKNLEMFDIRISAFKSRDEFDLECWKIACAAYRLMMDYPDSTIFRNSPDYYMDPYDSDDFQIISMTKYISFCADLKSGQYETIGECINNEFNEYGEIAEPTIFKPLDGSKIKGNDLKFEFRIFRLIDDLCSLLYDY